MDLIQVKGNTYYIDAGEAVPLYIKENKDCILLDSGWDFERDEIERTINEHGLHPVGILGTHLHTDHCGNHSYFQKKYQIPVAMSAGEAALGYNDMMLKAYLYIFTMEEVRNVKSIQAMRFSPDIIVPPEADEFEMLGVRFGIVHTPGHSPDHLSIITPDEVLYLGDAMLSRDVMDVSKVPYYASVEEAIRSMEKLADYSCLALAAHKGVDEDLKALSAYNVSQLKERIKGFHALITGKMTLEDIIQKTCAEKKMLSKQPFKVKLYERDIRSYVEYLADHGMIQEVYEGGRLYYTP